VARTGRAYRRIIVQFGGMATIRVTTRTHLFAFKLCAIQQTTHIVKLGFHSRPRTLLPLKAVARGPPSTAPRAVRREAPGAGTGRLTAMQFSLGCHGFIVPPSFDPHRLHPRLLVSASALCPDGVYCQTFGWRGAKWPGRNVFRLSKRIPGDPAPFSLLHEHEAVTPDCRIPVPRARLFFQVIAGPKTTASHQSAPQRPSGFQT
jgi:hypothetical protein